MKTATHLTPIAQLQEDILYTKREVADITGISIEEQNVLIEAAAYRWLEAIGCDSFMQLQFANTSEFWGFWKKTWLQADKQFINHWLSWDYDLSMSASWYHTFHNVKSNPMQGRQVHAAFHQLIKTIAVKR